MRVLSLVCHHPFVHSVNVHKKDVEQKIVLSVDLVLSLLLKFQSTTDARTVRVQKLNTPSKNQKEKKLEKKYFLFQIRHIRHFLNALVNYRLVLP